MVIGKVNPAYFRCFNDFTYGVYRLTCNFGGCETARTLYKKQRLSGFFIFTVAFFFSTQAGVATNEPPPKGSYCAMWRTKLLTLQLRQPELASTNDSSREWNVFRTSSRLAARSFVLRTTSDLLLRYDVVVSVPPSAVSRSYNT